MKKSKKANPVETVWDDNAVFRDGNIDGLIKLADKRDPAAAQYLRRMFVQAVKKGESLDDRLTRWVADRLHRIEWGGERADVALGIKPGSKPPVDSQRRFEQACKGTDIVRRVDYLAQLEPLITKCFERVAEELCMNIKDVQQYYYDYRVPENTSQE